MRRLHACLMAGVAIAVASPFHMTAAQATTISNGAYSVGIGPNGELYDYASGVGFRRNADGFDPLAPGTPRDSWGVSSGSSWATGDQTQGSYNIVSTTSTSTDTTASFTTLTNFGLSVSQGYAFVAPNVLRISETVSNTSSSTALAVLFQRDVDWDVVPTAFNENTYGSAVSGNVVDSSYYGFESSNPLVPYGASCAAGCNAVGDLGAGIKISLGDLAAGSSKSFNFYYALTSGAGNTDDLLKQVGALGASYALATQSTENGAFPNLGQNGAVLGYGLSAVPLPASAPMFGVALVALGLAGYGVKRRTSAAAA